MDERFWASVEAGAVVLAANARLARDLSAGYDRRQQAAGRRTWPVAAMVPLEAWLERSWDGACLSAAQEQLLWERIITTCEPTAALLDAGAMAEAAAAAWRLAFAWQLPFEGGEWEQSEDTAAFRRWAQRFARELQAAGWRTHAELADAVAERLRTGALPPPARVWLAGFDELTPQQRALAAALRAAGASIEEHAAAGPEAELWLVAARDTEEELERAAAWARQQLEANANGTIAVVVPGLEAERDRVERIFLAALHPGRPPWSEAPRAFHLSLGPPLAQHPVVASGLRILEAMAGPSDFLDMDTFGALLRSPFLAGAETEAGQRAAWEAELRRAGRTGIRLGSARGRAGGICPQWAAAAGRALALRRSWPGEQSTGAWAAAFEAMLDAWGWPGERGLNSAEHQARQAWDEALHELARLDQVSGATVSASSAVVRLRRIASARAFQPRPAQAAPVQILGWLEAAGQQFERLWITGLHDGAVPGPAAPHPFLPLAWQREREIPHASAAREADFAARTLTRLRRSALEAVASYPEREGEIALHPSPLLAQAPVWTDAPAPAGEPAAAPLEGCDDLMGPALSAENRHGGSLLFTAQSACPFQAFARLRLDAHALEPVPAGLAATTRGTLLHRVLERIWGELESQATLRVLTPEALRQKIEVHAVAVVEMEPLLRGRPGLADLERERLARLALEWLDKEKARPAAFTVLGRELEREAEFAGFHLSLRLDRVDALEDGSRILIDYKSGKPSKGDWRPPRPNQPQLPLYLVTDPDPATVAAVAFAQLQPGEMSLKAMARGQGLLQRAQVPEDWSALETSWREALERLAEEFGRGYAVVAPKSRKSCEHCDLPALCRIAVSAQDLRLQEWEEAEEAEEHDA